MRIIFQPVSVSLNMALYTTHMVCLCRAAFVATSSLLAVVVVAQQRPVQVALWEKGAPGFEKLRNEPEEAKDYWVRHINNPSVTVFLPPKETATGAAVVICPGGGHRELVYNAEGVEPALFLNSLGIAAFVLKYRLSREANSPYAIDKHPREDAYRAMRLVRSRAREWNIDTGRVGMLGFSAGGEVVAMVAYAPGIDHRTGNTGCYHQLCQWNIHCVLRQRHQSTHL